jgi:hypothetical protein
VSMSNPTLSDLFLSVKHAISLTSEQKCRPFSWP